MRGRLLPAAGPTTNHGSILDHIVVSRHLEASASLATSWEVPWRPHCALLLTLTAAGRGPNVWRLQQFPKIVAQAEQYPWPTEERVKGLQPTVCIMGEAPPQHDAASALLCRWSQVLEVYHDQTFVGRGWSINPIYGDIPSARPVAASLGSHAGWWARVCHVAQRAWRSNTQESTDELWAWLRDSASRWQAGGQVSFETYLSRVEVVFANLPSSTLDDILQPLREQTNLAQAAASKQHADSYKQWLHLGMSKGMKPLFRAMAKGEVGLERPFREVEPAQRAIDRRDQWVEIWGDAQRPWTGESKLMLHAKHTEPLQPITGRMLSVSANAKADKAGGLTGLTFSAVRNLPDQAYEQLAIAFNEVEASGRYDVVQKWISEVGVNAVWDRATPGNTCLEVGIARLVRAETSRCNGKHRVAVLFDLSNFYDLVDFELLEERIITYGFPARVAALVVQTYRAARHIEAEDILSEVIYPRTGMLAGCPFAVALAKTYLWPILQEIHGMKGVQALDSWVDDIGADLEHASATVVAQDAVACFRHAKILLEGSGLKVSMKKTGFLTSSKEARRELAERLRLFKGSVVSSATWGTADIALSLASDRVRDPKADIICQHFQAGLNTGHDQGFWERGLVAKLSYPARHSKPVITGEWLQKVASICCELPGSQTVFRGELFAVAVAAQRTTGLCDVTLDCQSVAKRLKAGKKGGKHEDIWHTITEEDGFQRLRPFWIRSHLQPEQFDKVFGFESRWRFNINQTADALCGKFAHELVDATFVDKLRKQDTAAEQVLCCLASRVETILSAKPPNQHPTIIKGTKQGQVTQECETSAVTGTAKPLPGVQRTCKKKIGANVGHGHTQTRDEWFTSLVNEGGLSKHEWAWKGPDLVCNRCGWKLLHAKNRKFLVERENTPCGADGPVKFAGVHVSHDMQLQGQLWLCVQCGGAYSVHGASSAKLKSACTNRRDARSKVQ
ncbi:unnamed protein product, partial [Symbiodinium sp. KB8]